MPRFIHAALALILITISSASSAQQYDSFRFVGEVSITPSGSVSSVEFEQAGSQVSGKLSYLDVAGLSTVYDIVFSASHVIKPDVPVYMPSADFAATDEPSLNLDNVQFLTAKLVNTETPDSEAPAHWFRMTVHNNVWSGMFRIANRVYSINRDVDSVVEVRTTQSANEAFQPARQIKIAAVIDEEYVFEDPASSTSGLDNFGHIRALESLHVAEGLMSDSLDLSFRVDRLAYLKAQTLTSANTLAGAESWLASNADAYGITGHYAAFFFRGAETGGSNIADKVVLQSKSDNHQQDSAWYFGQLLGLPSHSGTLNGDSKQQSQSSAYWNDSQREHLINNPPPAELTRTLSYDEPEIEVVPPTENAPIPDYILDSESEESNNGVGIQSDFENGDNGSTSQNSASTSGGSGDGGGSSGGGVIMPLWLFILAPFVLARTRSRSS